jgi:hypothetical protein
MRLIVALLVPSILAAAPGSSLTFRSSDERLSEAFRWARRQALAYVFDGDPVGPWYEAALPGRQAFCMRDVSHQSGGAHALGLAPYTYNMLHRFAENIAESRDWCSYWEINRENKPAPVDYKSDQAFWYDLPANFDVLDACARMYRWTGDRRYLTDPAFLNFYDRSVRDFVSKWQLSPELVMKRQLPVPPPGISGPAARFFAARGIPSYIEGGSQFVVGVDLLAAEYAGFLAYSQIQQLRGNAAGAREYQRKALEVKKLVNEGWWNEGARQFYSTLNRNRKLQGSDRLALGDRALLYYGVAEDGVKARSALDGLLERIKQPSSLAVEEQSHYAEIFYRHGLPDVAYAQIMDLTRPDRKRREYPEVSYAVIGAMVGGMMGIAAETDQSVSTLPALVHQTAWAEIAGLPVRANVVSLREEENRIAVLTNQSGPALQWQARFPGSVDRLLVDGKPVRAQRTSAYSWVEVSVKPGTAVRVEVPTSGSPRNP